nr:ABC transporter ATP-binding protein [Lysinibacillus timonensis]
MNTNNREISSFKSLILKAGIPKIPLIVGLSLSFITTIFSLVIPLLTREIVDGFAISSINLYIIAAIVIVFILQAVIDGTSMFLLSYVGQKLVAQLREMIWKRLIRLPVTYFDRQQSGEIVSRVVNDTGIVKDLISQHFPNFISGLISIIGAVIVLFIMDWKMTLIMLISVPVTAMIMVPLGTKMAKISRGLQDETAKFTGNIQQTLSEIRLMKSSNAEKYEEARGITGIKKLLTLGLNEAKILALISPVMYTIVMAVIVMIIGYGGIRVANGTMTTGSLVAFLLYLFQIIYPITAFALFFTELSKAKGATERIIEILNIELEEGHKESEFIISDESIIFDNVSFSYDQEHPVIQNVSFKALPGEMIAFAGPSGGGKTTLFALLERYYEPTNGEIRIGNVPIHELSLESWRSQIGYVSQESSMLAGTIRENLCYGLVEDIDDEQLWAVAKMAYADDFIQTLPDGLDTEVGERGVKLSGGQRQRIAIARAFLRNPKVLLMDEATASLDSESEHVVQQALSHLMKGRTTFIIAHRLSTIVDADQIIFIENGKITGFGKHEELMKSHQLYRHYAEQQLNN